MISMLIVKQKDNVTAEEFTWSGLNAGCVAACRLQPEKGSEEEVYIWHPDGIKAFTDDPNFKKKKLFGFVKGTVTVEGYLILSECQIKKRENPQILASKRPAYIVMAEYE
jgi:hypothetical protein